MNFIIFQLSTWFASGKAPFAPGTFGTLAALPFAWLIHAHLGPNALTIASLLVFAVGIPISNAHMRITGSTHDPSEIVIDEVAGVWLLLAALPLTLNAYILGFVLFRIFDVLKPWPISWVDRKVGGGFGVMLDDMLAGFMAILVVLSAILCGVPLTDWL